MLKLEFRVTSYELLVTSWKLKSTSWNSKLRVQIHNCKFTTHDLRVWIHNFQDQIHESRVQIHELRVQIHELRAQIKNTKRDSVSAYVHMSFDMPSPFTQLYAFWMLPPSSKELRTYLINSPLETIDLGIHWNINIRKNEIFCAKLNGSVGWKKHLGEEH